MLAQIATAVMQNTFYTAKLYVFLRLARAKSGGTNAVHADERAQRA
jgi:hypothetical protein